MVKLSLRLMMSTFPLSNGMRLETAIEEIVCDTCNIPHGNLDLLEAFGSKGTSMSHVGNKGKPFKNWPVLGAPRHSWQPDLQYAPPSSIGAVGLRHGPRKSACFDTKLPA